MKNKKKAFTLTELLVVVIVIGVLSAAVLPKFNKVIETRKTTEAEELMASIRTEQEKRCALDKQYLTKMSELTDIVKKDNTKNYAYTLENKGIIASSKGNYSYNLQMPSYADGRICCSGNDCEKLNKNYPKCEGFNYEPSPDSCAGTVEEVKPEPEPEPTPCEKDPTSCECNPNQAKCCPPGTQWDGSACVTPSKRECTAPKPLESQECNGCGMQEREVTCNYATGQWETGSWNECSSTKEECSECPEGKKYDASSGKCVCDSDDAKWCTLLTPSCGEGEEEKPGINLWDEDTCSCESYCWTGQECSTTYSECPENTDYNNDTCDGDTRSQFTGIASYAVGTFSCIDIYGLSVGGSNSSGKCYNDPYHPTTCPAGQSGMCLNGVWRCYTPCPRGGCAGGTTNPMPDMPLDTNLLRVECRVLTQTCTAPTTRWEDLYGDE